MVKKIAAKLQPTHGFAHIFHLSLVAILPILVFIFVRLELDWIALAVILLSKWRIFAIQPRHWLAHLRTNAVDIGFSVSILAFMADTDAMSLQLLWVLVYEAWVLYLKPKTGAFAIGLQSLLAFSFGLTALFLQYREAGLWLYVTGAGVIAYLSARHFFGGFEEGNYGAYSWTWALFAMSTVWLLGHWLLFYGAIAQPAVLLSVLGYGFGSLYYLRHTDRLSKVVQRQVIFVITLVVLAILFLSDWGSGSI